MLLRMKLTQHLILSRPYFPGSQKPSLHHFNQLTLTSLMKSIGTHQRRHNNKGLQSWLVIVVEKGICFNFDLFNQGEDFAASLLQSSPTSKTSLMCRLRWVGCCASSGGQTNIVRQGFTGFGNSVLFFSANILLFFKIYFPPKGH